MRRQRQQRVMDDTKCENNRDRGWTSHPGVQVSDWPIPAPRQTFHDAQLQGSRRPMQAADWWHGAFLQDLQGIQGLPGLRSGGRRGPTDPGREHLTQDKAPGTEARSSILGIKRLK